MIRFLRVVTCVFGAHPCRQSGGCKWARAGGKLRCGSNKSNSSSSTINSLFKDCSLLTNDCPSAEEERNNQSQRGAWIARWGVQTVGEQGGGKALGHASKWRNENFIVFVPQVLEKVSHFDYVFAYIKQRLSVFSVTPSWIGIQGSGRALPFSLHFPHTHFALGTGSANRAQFSTWLCSLWSVARLKALAVFSQFSISLACCALCTSHCCWHCHRATPTRHWGKANSPGSVFATKSSLIHDAPFWIACIFPTSNSRSSIPGREIKTLFSWGLVMVFGFIFD